MSSPKLLAVSDSRSEENIMGGKHSGEPTDRPWNEDKDRGKAGSTGDNEGPRQGGDHGKDGKGDE